MVDIDALSVSSSWWARVDIAALFIVTIGVVLEGIAEWLPKERRETRFMIALTRTGWLILVLALIVEFIAQRNKDASDALITAALNDRAGLSERETEELRSKNLALEAEIAPRRLTSDQIAALTAAAKPFAGRAISIWSYGIDLEAGMLAIQIKFALQGAGVPIVDDVGHMVTSWTPRVGVIITGPDDTLIETLLTALKPVSATRGSLDPAKAAIVLPAEIFVGVKPLSP